MANWYFCLGLSLLLLSPVVGKNPKNAVKRANIYLKKACCTANTPIKAVDTIDLQQDIKIVVHGYLASKQYGLNSDLANEYLRKGLTNVFLADWNDAATFDYLTSRNLVEDVGQHYAAILGSFVETHGTDLNRLHLIGHSLGAHICGEIGKQFGGRVGRITGLDPAQPLFLPTDGLQNTDAIFVDVIHTGIPVYGDLTPRGDIDFYPNSGIVLQPNCMIWDILSADACSHILAIEYFRETIRSPSKYPAFPCPIGQILSRIVGDCNSDAAESDTVYMGENANKSAKGTYFLKT